MKNWLKWFVKAAVATVILVLLFTRIDFRQVLSVLAALDVRMLGPILLSCLAALYVSACQMSCGLGPLGLHFRVSELFRIGLIACFYSLFLPGQLAGGAVSWYKISRSSGRGVQAWALIIYFRAVNVLVLLGLGVLGVWFDRRLAATGLRSWVLLLFACAVILALPLFCRSVARLVDGCAVTLGRRCSPIMRVRRSLADRAGSTLKALHALTQTPRMFAILGLSLLINVLGVCCHYLTALALEIHLPLMVLAWTCTAVAILQLIPVSIGGLGVREASLVLLLQDYGVPAPQALSYSLALFGVMVVTGLLGGGVELSDTVLRHRYGLHGDSQG